MSDKLTNSEIDDIERVYCGVYSDNARIKEVCAQARLANAQGEAVAWIRFCSDGSYEGPIMDCAMEDVRKKSGAWTPLCTGPMPDLAKAIHYPDCWDTTAYPTVADALGEVYGSFKCSNDDKQHPDSLPDEEPTLEMIEAGIATFDPDFTEWDSVDIAACYKAMRAHIGRK